MRIILFTLFVLLVYLTSCSDEERTFQSYTDLPPHIKTDKLTNIINQIAGNNTIEGEFIGIAGSPSGQSRRLKQLDSIATNVQLTSFTDHANPVVRYYSFRARVRRKSGDIFDILLNHITDTV